MKTASHQAQEIERKFLVDRPPVDFHSNPSVELEQGFLALCPDSEVRVRREGLSSHSLTVKQGTGMIRTEVNVVLTSSQFEELWPFTIGRRIQKRRYSIPFGNKTILLDEFYGTNEGLVLAEIEFTDELECQEFRPPDWIGKEVTGDKKFFNANLIA